MSTYPDARRVVLTLADLRRLTVLERARACAIVGIAEQQAGGLLTAISKKQGDPGELERGVELLYAFALMLERRLDPSLTWEQAQGFDLALDLETEDATAEAEALASVETAIATGLSPREAGELTLAQVDAYRVVADRAGAPRARTRRARVYR